MCAEFILSRQTVLILTLLLLIPAVSTPLVAQLSTTATIAGEVTDSTGAVVPDATVTAIDEATRITTVRKTGPDGSYVIPSLTIDTYTVSISKPIELPADEPAADA